VSVRHGEDPIPERRLLALVEQQPVATLSLLFVLCVAVFLATIPLPRADNLLIGSEGVLYYHCVRSFVIPVGDAITFRQLVWDKFVLPVGLMRRVLR
jgi:hypothetical protein